MKILCPICQAETDLSESTNCQSCGSLLNEEVMEESSSSLGLDALKTPPPKEMGSAPVEAEELLDAFRLQFEEHRVTVPAGWTARLRRLAEETESGRRYATIVFVDLRGYTRLSQKLSEARLKDLRQWFHALCTRHVERHGGFLIQLLGDAAFAAFGAPWAFERDAEAAIKCLLEIRDEVRAMQTWDGEPVAVRAGAASGVINVGILEEGGRKRPDLVGSPVNLAARLEAYAATWEVLVPGELAELVGGVFDIEPREPFEPKNYGSVVRPHAVTAHKGAEAVRRNDEVPFVERAAERAALRRWFDAARAGTFVCARIDGVAGVGKSRLVGEFLATTPVSGIDVHQLTIEPHERHVLLCPFAALVRQVLARLAGAGVSEEAALERLPALLPGFDPAGLAPLGYLLGLEEWSSRMKGAAPSVLRSSVESALLGLVDSLAARSPLALVFDDIQWCDQLSLAVLQSLALRAPAGVLMLLVGRLDEADYSSEYVSSQLPTLDFPGEKLVLGPLDREQRAQLLAGIVDPQQLHPILRERLLDETEGIPLYIVEMAVEAQEQSARVSAGELAHELVEGTPIERQKRLIDLFQARLDRLSTLRRTILQCGAVLGRRFSFGILSAHDEIRERLMEELALLKGARMLRDAPLPADIEFTFTPTMLREVAYQMLTDEQRQHMHAVYAALIEKRFHDRLGELRAELTSHWVRAGRLDKARPYIRQACLDAIRIGTPQEGFDLAVRGIRLSEKFIEEEQNAGRSIGSFILQQIGLLREQAGRAARALGDFDLAIVHFDAWFAIAAEIGNAIWQVAALHQKALTLFEQGDLGASESLLAQAQSAGKVTPALAEHIAHTLAGIRYRQARYEEALAAYRAIADAPKSPPTLLQGDSWSSCGLCLWQLGRHDEAADSFRRASEIYAANAAPHGEVLALNNLGIIREKQGDLAAAMATYDDARRRAEHCGYLHGLSAIACNRANLAYLSGDDDAAQRDAARSLRLARMIGHGNSEALALINLALAQSALAQLGEAATTINEALALARRMGDTQTEATATLEHAWIALLAGDIDGARATLANLDGTLAAEETAWKGVLEQAIAAHAAGTPLPPGDETEHPSVRRRRPRVEAWLRAAR